MAGANGMRHPSSTVRATLLAIALAAPSAASAQTTTPVAVSIVQAAETLTTLPLIYARSAGLFEKVGLNVTWLPLTPNTAQVAAILAAGQADFAQGGASLSLSAQAVGKDIVAFGVMTAGTFLQLSLNHDVLAKMGNVTVTSPLAERIRALKGLRIAISPPGNTPYLVFQSLAQSAGIDADKDVTLIPVSNFAALTPTARAGRADGLWLSPPYTTVPTVEGWGKIWIDLTTGSVEAFKYAPALVIASRRATLESKPEAARRVIQALQLAMADIKRKPQQVKDFIRPKYFENLDSRAFDIAFDQLAPSFDHDMVATERGYEQLLAITVVTDVAGKPVQVPFERAFDNSIVRAVNAAK
jgi:sulfonate transport system substrate-binding protein